MKRYTCEKYDRMHCTDVTHLKIFNMGVNPRCVYSPKEDVTNCFWRTRGENNEEKRE